jgi:hypothetical protein
LASDELEAFAVTDVFGTGRVEGGSGDGEGGESEDGGNCEGLHDDDYVFRMNVSVKLVESNMSWRTRSTGLGDDSVK